MGLRHVTTLAIRPGAIGDFIVSIPALEALGADLEVWTAAANVPLARCAHRTCSIASTGLDLLGLPDVAPSDSLLARLRSFDRIVSWYGANRPEFIDAVRALRLPFDFFPALPSMEGSIHAVDFFSSHVGAPPGATPRIVCPGARGDFAVIHPFASSPSKRWPLDRFQEVARLLPMPVRWCAGPEEALDGAVRIPNLYQLACWLATARVYIGNDSGISHLAAAVGTPVVALFGPTNPIVWAPRGPSVTVLSPMERVEPQKLVDAL
ncbi:MAG: glycosyltransferase family 9 protein [Bryobacteraceae bacterium]